MLCSGNGSHVRSDIPFAIWELIKVIHCDAELSFFLSVRPNKKTQ